MLVCLVMLIQISKISNCYLFDLNDLEQFFSLFFGENNMGKFDDRKILLRRQDLCIFLKD